MEGSFPMFLNLKMYIVENNNFKMFPVPGGKAR